MIRKLLTVVEETRYEADQAVTPPTRKAAAIAVVWNPYVGRRTDDLSELIDAEPGLIEAEPGADATSEPGQPSAPDPGDRWRTRPGGPANRRFQ